MWIYASPAMLITEGGKELFVLETFLRVVIENIPKANIESCNCLPAENTPRIELEYYPCQPSPWPPDLIARGTQAKRGKYGRPRQDDDRR